MLVAIFSHLVIARSRILLQLIPKGFARRGNLWQLGGLLFFSFFLQVVLVLWGNRRKYKYQIWVRAILWVAYQAADWATNFSLSVLSRGQDDYNTNSPGSDFQIMAFWGPLFLLHLCSPDTITAYSLEDNELWLRHLFSLSGQVGVAIYVLYRSWIWSPINCLAIPMLLVGMIKFAEMIWVQYMASSNQFRDSMITPPDPGPNYAKFMDTYNAKEAEGFKIEPGPLIEIPMEEGPVRTSAENIIQDVNRDNIGEEYIVQHAYRFFETFKRLFADLILSFQDYEESRSFFHNNSWEVAFKVIEVELGFIYDVLYTKAIVIHSPLALVIRLISSLLAAIVLCAFTIIYWHDFPKIDVTITCSLLAGAIFVEFYEVILFFSSDWRMLWLRKHKILLKIVSFLRSWHLVPADKRWSDHMAQYNLLKSCLEEKSDKLGRVRKFFHEKLERYGNKKAVSPALKELIFKLLVQKSKEAKNMQDCKKLCDCRGGQVLEKKSCLDQLGWSVEVEFDKSILLWHIATDLCYFQDKSNNPYLKENSICKISRLLSDYMLYLLDKRPSMMPNGIGQIRFQDTCAEAIDFLEEWRDITDENQACKELLRVATKLLPSEVKGDRSKSVLFDACMLAKSLQTLETHRKWEMVSHVWVEMLSYAASHCQWQYHAKQLTKGGELLTHVWLLMAHLGISEQFQISEGHGRLKLRFS